MDVLPAPCMAHLCTNPLIGRNFPKNSARQMKVICLKGLVPFPLKAHVSGRLIDADKILSMAFWGPVLESNSDNIYQPHGKLHSPIDPTVWRNKSLKDETQTWSLKLGKAFPSTHIFLSGHTLPACWPALGNLFPVSLIFPLSQCLPCQCLTSFFHFFLFHPPFYCLFDTYNVVFFSL